MALNSCTVGYMDNSIYQKAVLCCIICKSFFTGRWWCTCRNWSCRPWEWQVQNQCSLPFYPWWWRTCCQWLPWWKTNSGFGGSGSISGFGGSGFQNGGIGGDGFDSMGGARGIAGFGVRGRSRLGGKNY